MKKISTRVMLIFTAVLLVFLVSGCGNNSSSETDSKTKVKITQSDESDDYSENEKEPISLNEDIKYVIVAIKSKHIVIDSEEDFSKYKVAYIGGTDGEAYAKYYEFEESGMYNSPNDLHSGITGMSFDIGLISEDKVKEYDDWEVVWEMVK